MKGQVRKTPTEFLDNELVIASLDGYGRLQVSDNADEWFGERFVKVELADMTVSGIDLTPLIPAGFRVVSVLGSRSLTGSQVIYLEAFSNNTGVFIDLNFGANFEHNGRWKTIGPLTSNGSFPLWVKMIPKA